RVPVELVVRRYTAVVCFPVHAEAGKESRGKPDRLASDPARCAAGHVWPGALGHGRHPRQLPPHRPVTVDVVVRSGDHHRGAGSPDEAALGIEHLTGPERKPSTDTDPSPHGYGR